MRILLTTDTVGGVWTFTRDLAGQLLSAGDHVALVSFGREPSADQRQWTSATSAAFGDRFLAYVSDAPLEWMQNNDRTFEEGKQSLLEVCDGFAPDILHSNQFCWGALDFSVPVVVTAHSDVLSWAQACKPDGLEESAWLRRYRRLVQDGLDGAGAVTAPTAWMASTLQHHFPIRSDVQVIANGRSLTVRSHRRKLQAVSAGRLWDEAKGLSTFVDMKSPIPVVVAGESNREAFAYSSLTFAGALSADETVRLFSESSIYIVTSLYEPFGLAPLEAALCGCAVIARDLPSLREVWCEAATYFRTVGELESILSSFAHDAELLKSRRTAALQRAQNFTATKMARAYQALYRSLVCEDCTPVMQREVAVYA